MSHFLNIQDNLRPSTLKDFIGQEKIKRNLKVFIESAKLRKEHLDHTIFYGPPGLGKTTLAYIIANELNVKFYAISGPVIKKPIDLLGILTSLSPKSVLFIDEIHRLPKVVEEYLYSALEDFKIDIPIESGLSKEIIRVNLEPFTLVGATTRIGMVGKPLRERFGISFHLDFYNTKEIFLILKRNAKILNIKFENEGALYEIAKRSRGTPRIANNLLKRVRDFAVIKNKGVITKELTQKALDEMDIDEHGLNPLDRKILKILYEHLNSGPLGIKTISNMLGEEVETIETLCEPFLLKQGFIKKTPRGRMITPKGIKIIEKSHFFSR